MGKGKVEQQTILTSSLISAYNLLFGKIIIQVGKSGQKGNGNFPDNPTSCMNLCFIQQDLSVLGLQWLAEHIPPAPGREQRQTMKDMLA
jgi:hypothetical protein